MKIKMMGILIQKEEMMETNKHYKPLLIDSVQVAVDVEEHRFIGFNGNYCAVGTKALGVVDVSTEKGQYAPVAISGIVLVEAAEALVAGDEVTSDATGKAIKVARTEVVNGYALDSVSAGELVRVVRGI